MIDLTKHENLLDERVNVLCTDRLNHYGRVDRLDKCAG